MRGQERDRKESDSVKGRVIERKIDKIMQNKRKLIPEFSLFVTWFTKISCY